MPRAARGGSGGVKSSELVQAYERLEVLTVQKMIEALSVAEVPAAVLTAATSLLRAAGMPGRAQEGGEADQQWEDLLGRLPKSVRDKVDGVVGRAMEAQAAAMAEAESEGDPSAETESPPAPASINSAA